ncbi:uncharacterized protein LOC132927945 [Rhopalosiphum padi]|uniref:uncharacterized protein LOC132927945 n=1 Tax=Rhopalosiphum padi TaxID=40932 RepID=UPI00298E03C1|nr:uncharacterized protein LOC132927945 [Rhopalosiphum padi]
MNSSSEEDSPSKPSGSSGSNKTKHWLAKQNPSSSKSYAYCCPYTLPLRKTGHLKYMNQLWTLGDIVSLCKSESPKIFYAQIIELYENDFCEKLASIFWLAPKAYLGATEESKKHHDKFIPSEFEHSSVIDRLVPIHCLTFVMNVPNLFDYRIQISANNLVNTYIASHAERYAESSSESDEDKGTEPKCKIARLLNK